MLAIDIEERSWIDLATAKIGNLNIHNLHNIDSNFAAYHKQHIAGLTSENR